MNQTLPKVVVGVSGGVDSSVTALLLRNKGYPIQGVFMKNWIDIHGDGQCPIAEDLADAENVCNTLGIPFSQVNFAPEYWDRVFSHFLAEYKAGRTPNPDILCNREIKFDVFLKTALDMGAEYIATGHYARNRLIDGQYHLLRGLDANKDQSYFLYTLGQAQLKHTLFPVGELEKPEVRAIAEQYHLHTHDKKDSTGICFIGERNFTDFLQNYLPAQPGSMQDPDGKIIGQHNGLMYYTLGQRKGLQIGGRNDSSESPWFVVGKKIRENILVVAQGHEHPLLQSQTLHAGQLHWVSGSMPPLPYHCYAKTRYRQSDQACTITDILPNGQIRVAFDQPQRAVTPGQSVVFYQGEDCLGGGVIEHVDGIIYQ
ncbi:MAG: tRNA 2-thiouridine(34) synthase MnmA [Gammaproteobacteria bacterium]|nr:tRNA 2-thiouridine(34) synthase MnmA [Gammaproteobacteria bacterium]